MHPPSSARYDEDVAQVAREIIADQGVPLRTSVRVQSFKDGADSVTVTTSSEGAAATGGGLRTMVATGRKPATEVGLLPASRNQ